MWLDRSNSENGFYYDDEPNLNDILASCTLRFNISHIAINDLLKNFKKLPTFSTKNPSKEART